MTESNKISLNVMSYRVTVHIKIVRCCSVHVVQDTIR